MYAYMVYNDPQKYVAHISILFFAEAKAIPYYFNKYLRKLYSKDGESEKFFCHEIFCHTIQMVNEKPHP